MTTLAPPDIERRTVQPMALRVVRRSDGASRIVGQAAVFCRPSQDLGGFVETIATGAFREALQRSDVRCLFNHQPDHVLGRVPRTLRLWETDTALEYECDVPDTTVGRDVLALIRRGDVRGNSFSFIVDKDRWHAGEDGLSRRTILSVKELIDVGPVTYPAYPDTVVSARALDRARRVGRRTPRLPPEDQERVARFEAMQRWATW